MNPNSKNTSSIKRYKLNLARFPYKTIIGILTFLPHVVLAQELLTRQDAMTLALKNNYDIQVAEKSVESAKTNASVFNTGFLPTISAAAGANITYNEGENRTVQGDFAFEPAEAYSYNASVGLTHVLFNGFGRLYNFMQLKEQHNLTELQAKQIMENTAVQLSRSYFEIAQLSETLSILENALEVSKQRVKRAEYRKEYGQGTQLDLLNAQVDLNNDSINLLNTSQQLLNAKRTLNLIMGRGLEIDFEVDTNVAFQLAIPREELIAKALDRNIQIQQTNSQLRNSEFAMKASRAGWFPSLSANASYAYQGQDNPNGAFLLGNEGFGPQAGLSLSWNIFDGGTTKTRMATARIALETQQIQREQTALTVQRDVMNAYASYQNALFVLEAEKANLLTSKRNFERSKEMYDQGQVNSIEFRTAQLNQLNAQSGYSQAKYNAKNAELQLMQLAGILVE